MSKSYERWRKQQKFGQNITTFSVTERKILACQYFFSMSDEESHSKSEFYYPEEEEHAKTEQNNMTKVTTHGDENFSNSQEELQKFFQEQKSENTVKKTSSDMKCFYRFLGEQNETNVQILDLPPEELDHLLRKFFKDVRKINGEEYESSTLTGMQRSIQMFLSDSGSKMN